MAMFVANGCEMQKMKHHRHNLFSTVCLRKWDLAKIVHTILYHLISCSYPKRLLVKLDDCDYSCLHQILLASSDRYLLHGI